MHEAVFLDRDGVVNRGYLRDGKSYAPRETKDFRLLPYAAKSIERLKEIGFLVIVVTNQPDINNGLVSIDAVNGMHSLLRRKTQVDDIFLCPHSQDENCDCRKPKPGMLIKAAEKYNIDLKRSFMVGDRASDISAGRQAGCKTIFINRNYREDGPLNPDFTAHSLRTATNFILNNK